MNKPAHIQLGQKGEDLAVSYLEKQGYRLVARNFRSGRSEIDIIALYEEILVVTEVKSFQAPPLGPAEFRVHKKKQKQLIKATHLFLNDHPQFQERDIRFDVIIVDFSTWPADITHHQGAFQADNYWNDGEYY